MTRRKDEHVKLAEKFHGEPKASDFDNIRFVHHSFPEMSVEEADISTSFSAFTIGQPFFINAITGGSENTKSINERLAIVARETRLPMASGSLSVAIKDSSLVDSFKIIRKANPKGIVFANLGAEHTVENANRAIDILEANALQIHCNAVQEIIMPEGNRDFSNWLNNIEKMVKSLNVPIIVKEVGFGMSRKTIKQLKGIGVETIDISGSGGTNFAKIENYRRGSNRYYYMENFGQSTVISLLKAQEFIDNTDIIASGGIRNPLDIVKALSLGAKAVGVSGLFLNMVLNDGVEKTIKNINSWKTEIASIMTLLGKREVPDLVKTDLLVSNEVREWCLDKGVGIRDKIIP